MTETKQYQLNGNELILSVKKSSAFTRYLLFLLASLFFLLPFTGMAFYLADGNKFQVGLLIGLFLFGILGFYLLRLALWNTFGKEVISFNKNKVSYIADYGWFKDGKKQRELEIPFSYSVQPIGFLEDQTGGLIIGPEKSGISCVTKIPIQELKEIIEKLENTDNIV